MRFALPVDHSMMRISKQSPEGFSCFIEAGHEIENFSKFRQAGPEVPVKEEVMAFSLSVTAEHQRMIAAILEKHYQAHDIDSSAKREDAEFFLKVIFVNGVQSPVRLKAALEVRQRELKRRVLAGLSRPVDTNSVVTA